MERFMYDMLYRIEETHWWYVGRRRLLLDQIVACYSGQRHLRVLDIGCGTGIFMRSLQSYGTVFGLDLAADALRFCQQRQLVQLVQGDGASLPFYANTFDLVTANDLLEHLDDDRASLQEFRRVLKPGGRAVIFVPAYQFLWSLQDEISHHKRRYTLPQLSGIVQEAGLTPEKITCANMLLFPLIFTGRQVLKVLRRFLPIRSENDVHPRWTNALLMTIFGCEVPLLRHNRFPFGVSLLAVCRKPE
jgi:SAM-dependent methyltransferase